MLLTLQDQGFGNWLRTYSARSIDSSSSVMMEVPLVFSCVELLDVPLLLLLCMYVSGYFIGGRIWYTHVGNGWGLCAFRMLVCVDQEVGISVVFEVFDSG